MSLSIARDFRYAIRQIRGSPGFTTTAALLIAVGIAATTLIFSLVDAILLRPLPVRDPHNLVQLFVIHPKRPADPYFIYRFYQRLAHDSSTLFETVGQLDTVRALEHGGRTERIHAEAVTANFFGNLAVVPLLGRTIGSGDTHVAMLSNAYWSRSFARDPKVLGQVVHIQDHAYVIIGITPPEFTGTTLDSSPDVWIPFGNLIEFSRTPNPKPDDVPIEITSRLRPGVSRQQAEQESAVLWEADMRADPNVNPLGTDRLQVQSIAYGVSPLREQSKTALILLLAGTGLLLAMVCANVGGLLLSRAAAREKETAVRFALGASRGRILRQWLIESLMITMTGGLAGVFIAYCCTPILMRSMPPAHGIGYDPGEIRTLALQVHLDFRVASFSIALCALTAVLCALAPAWRSSPTDISMALKSAISDKRNRLFQEILCGLQIALCTLLLLSAGLMIRSLASLRTSNTGFNQEHVILFSVDPQVQRYDARKTWLLEQRLLDGVPALTGAEGAALASSALMRGIGLGTSVVFPGQAGDGIINTSVNSVSPEYFDVMGIRFLQGRNFLRSESVEENKLSKAIVNEAFIRKFLNGRDPLGRQFDQGKRFVRPQFEIIGVVNDTKYRSLREVPPPIVYTNDFGPTGYPERFILHVRTRGDPHLLIQPVRKLLQAIDPEVPLYQEATLSEEIDRSLWQERLLVVLTSFFGAFALLLSTIGLYGIVAYFVAQKQREIGLRLALGATSGHVIWLAASRVMPSLLTGILAGVALSRLANTWIGSMLYGVNPFDSLATSTVLLLLLGVGLAATLIPTLTAVRIDPWSILRQD